MTTLVEPLKRRGQPWSMTSEKENAKSNIPTKYGANRVALNRIKRSLIKAAAHY